MRGARAGARGARDWSPPRSDASGRIGLERKSSPPALSASKCFSSSCSPDRNTIGVVMNASRSRMIAVSSMPSQFGMYRSMRISSGWNVVELIQRSERIGYRAGAHAGLAQDRLGEDRLRAVVFDDQHANGSALSASSSSRDARHHVLGLRGQLDERVGAGAHRPQAHRQFAGCRKCQQGETMAQVAPAPP